MYSMQITSDTADWVSLGLINELGPRSLRRLLGAFGLPGNVLAADADELSRHVKPDLAAVILSRGREKKVELALDWLSRDGHWLITLADVQYPPLLLQIGSPPPMLYVIGEPSLLRHRGLAIVGSRNATPQGAANARNFAKAAALSGLSIISGLALGIDTAAHQGALDAGGLTVAVLGCGADTIYPRSNVSLARTIAERGAIVSEFPLGTAPMPTNFPRRNRIISGLCEGCLVVEAALASGSLITAKLAAEQGKEVFAIPGSIHSPHSRGCHALIREGAKLVESAQDIMLELNLPVNATAQGSLVPGSALLQYIGYDPCTLDDLVTRSSLPAESVTATLLTLELNGRVGRLPGGWYQRIN